MLLGIEDLIISVQAERLRELLRWRYYVEVFAKAVRRALGE